MSFRKLCALALTAWVLLVGSASAQTIDVGMEKDSGVEFVQPGALLVYSLTVTNYDPTEVARAMTIRETVPLQTTFDGSQSAGWTCTGIEEGSECIFTLEGPIPPLESSPPIPFAVNLSLQAAGVLENTARLITNEHADTNPSNNVSTDTTPIGLGATADLSVSKAAQVSQATAGEVIVFEIGYGNSGNQSAGGVELIEVVPLGSAFFEDSSTPGWTCVAGGAPGTECRYSVGGLSGGGISDGSVDFAVRVSEPVPSGQEQILNTVLVRDDQTSGEDPDPSDNSAQATVALDGSVVPDLELMAQVTGDPASPGSAVTFDFQAVNSGNQNASGVSLAITLPDHTSLLGASIGLDCSAGTFCILNHGDLAGGSTEVLNASVEVMVDSPLPPGIDTLALMSNVQDDGTGGLDPTPLNNIASVFVSIDAGTSGPDLVLMASADQTEVGPADLVTFSFPYDNVGDRGASGTELVVQLPEDLTFETAGSSNFTCSGGVCTFFIGNVGAGAGGGTATLVARVASSVSAGTSSLNVTAVLSDDGANGQEQNPADNSATVAVAIEEGPAGGADPDLVLGAAADVTMAGAGDTIRYTFSYSNTGTQDASGVVLDVAEPAHTAVLAGDSSPFVCAAGRCLLTIGDLDGGGASGTATLTVLVEEPLSPGVMSIEIDGVIMDDGLSGQDLNPADNVAAVSIGIDSGPGGTAPDLTVMKSDGDVEIDAGGTIGYILTYANNGPQSASGVMLIEVVPNHTTFEAAGSSPFVCLADGSAGDVCSLELGTVAGGGGSGSATFRVTVDAGLPVDVVAIENTVQISDDGSGGEDLNPDNNSDTESTPIASTTAADVAITKSDGDAVAVLGGEVVYTLTVENRGTREAESVLVREYIPSFTTFSDSLSDPLWSCSGATCDLTISMLAAGEQVELLFGVDVSPNIPGGIDEISNTAEVSHPGPDLDSSNDLANELTPLDTQDLPDLRIVFANGTDAVDAGDAVLYQLDWSNVGTRDSAGVMLTVLFPEMEMNVDLAAGTAGWTCAGTSCSFDLGTIDAGREGFLELGFLINDPVSAGVEAVDLQATITDAGLAGPDGNPSDNTATVMTPIGTNGGGGTAPDLWVSKTVKSTFTARGGIAEFDLDYGNRGNQDEGGAVLIERIPENSTFSAESSSQGWNCLGEGPGSECYFEDGALAVGDQRHVVFAVEVGDELTPQLTNVAAIAGEGQDQNEGDNLALEVFGVGWVDLAVVGEVLPAAVEPGAPLELVFGVDSRGTVDPAFAWLEVQIGPNVVLDNPRNQDVGWHCQLVDETVFGCSVLLEKGFGGGVSVPIYGSAGDVRGTSIEVMASLSDDGSWGDDPVPTNNYLGHSVKVVGASGVDVGLTLNDFGIDLDPRSQYVIDVGVRNNGKVGATGTFLAFQVPAHTVFNEDQGSWTCIPSRFPPSICTVELGDVDPGESVFIGAPLVVDRQLPDDLTAIFFEVEAQHDAPDDNPADNRMSIETPVSRF